MAKINRKPFQGVSNIIRFNWHYYAFASFFCLICFFYRNHTLVNIAFFSTIILTIISLGVSLYIYDLSGFYNLNWLGELKKHSNIININAGFDETSEIILEKFPNCNLQVFDFYDKEKHSEISIERARNAYPAFKNTVKINTHYVPCEDNAIDCIFLIFAAHEIRNEVERIVFFQEINRILNINGQVIIVEHLRNIPNFLAYNIGFMHFYSKKTWNLAFEKSQLLVSKEQKITPFVNLMVLRKQAFL